MKPQRLCFRDTQIWNKTRGKLYLNEIRTFYTDDRNVWRSWLEEHFEEEDEVWFVFPTKDSTDPALPYNDAVEEALCFGWIDGRAERLDETHQIRRFTPRRKGSGYSRLNIERLIRLEGQGMIHPKIRPLVEDVLRTPFVYPEDILEVIRREETAWKHYQSFTESYRRIRIAYIEAARKRPEEFEKRLENFLKKTRENRRIIGSGGIENYYG